MSVGVCRHLPGNCNVPVSGPGFYLLFRTEGMELLSDGGVTWGSPPPPQGFLDRKLKIFHDLFLGSKSPPH